MRESWDVGGATALQLHAPTAAAAIGGLVSAWPQSLTGLQLASIRTVTGEALGLTPLPRPPSGPRRLSDVPRGEVMAFAEQFAVDVSVIDDRLRAGWFGVLGEDAFDATFAVYVADYVPRVRSALTALFGDDPWYDPAPSRTTHARAVMDEFIREVAMLDALDPVTTELVRLRGARQHGCRVCMSRRSLAAIGAGADAGTFHDLDHYRTGRLTPRQRAALALTDGVVWTPANLRRHDLDLVRAHLRPAEAVEVVLDVTRNACNKIAVALAADAAEVDGVQLFEVAADGALTFP